MSVAALRARSLLTVVTVALLSPLANSIRSEIVGIPSGSGPGQSAIPVTCQSVECVSLASQMASYMNTSADPCEDFYNYACGNFPSMVRYDPVRASAGMSFKDGDLLFEDRMSLMSDGLERNIYELLVLDRVASSPDQDISDLFNFTRLFYRSCRQWVHTRSGGGFGQPSASLNAANSASFFAGVLDHLNETLWTLCNEEVAMETVLATLVKTGGSSMLGVTLPRQFATNVIENDDFNLTQTARAVVSIDRLSLFLRGSAELERNAFFREWLDFLTERKLGAPLLNFGSLVGNASRPRFQRIIKRIEKSLNDNSLYGPGGCTVPERYSFGLDSGAKYNVSELDELSACVAAAKGGVPFSWSRFFDELLQSPVDKSALVQLPNIKEVINFVNDIKSRPVFAKSNDSSASLSDDAAFLVFDWLLSFRSFFPPDLQNLKSGRTQVARDIEGDGVASCMLWTKTLLQPILERMYQTAYHQQDFSDVNELVKLIKEAAITGVRGQSWITPSAKVAIEKKIRAAKETIGLDKISTAEFKAFYAPTLEEFRAVDLRPSNLDRKFGTLFSLALCAYAHKNFDVMSGLSPVTLFMEISPLVVNAFNWIERNQIIFPMAILAPPYYHPSYPPHISLGSIGYVIGHEIGHSFDNTGHQIDQQGAIGHFWDNETEANYLDRMECVRSRYGDYRLYPGGPVHLSNSTLGNDIADIIGIQAAVGALKLLKSRRQGRGRLLPRLPNLPASLSPEQQLFIQAAQSWCFKSEPHILDRIYQGWPSHSPHHLRVRGVAENSPEFAEAFKCRRGKPMNPVKKCIFW
ncbi:hypothetical protein BOX15_Mlig026970g1 [Macrostomum lignano]|uniref:Peptidase_M13 domain-containing protein n=1 Tax=Macrostomum lignano TaxID=282301 RepID=A0A267H621_9PLAT|nr:hypothetical protein BOX15_Mlig026970g1 [Macrostomum lignano]